MKVVIVNEIITFLLHFLVIQTFQFLSVLYVNPLECRSETGDAVTKLWLSHSLSRFCDRLMHCRKDQAT